MQLIICSMIAPYILKPNYKSNGNFVYVFIHSIYRLGITCISSTAVLSDWSRKEGSHAISGLLNTSGCFMSRFYISGELCRFGVQQCNERLNILSYSMVLFLAYTAWLRSFHLHFLQDMEVKLVPNFCTILVHFCKQFVD